jgi:hypothetical protein
MLMKNQLNDSYSSSELGIIRIIVSISIAERSEASTVFDRSNVVIAGSNPVRGMDVCLRFYVLCCPV